MGGGGEGCVCERKVGCTSCWSSIKYVLDNWSVNVLYCVIIVPIPVYIPGVLYFHFYWSFVFLGVSYSYYQSIPGSFRSSLDSRRRESGG